MSKTKVFVYGTLKKGNNIRGLDKLCANAKFVGQAETVRDVYSLYDLGSFPAVSTGGVHRIKGEVWEIDNELLKDQLDLIEGYPDFYDRKQVKTTLGTAWMYYIEHVHKYNPKYVVSHVGSAVEWTDSLFTETSEETTNG